jgi:hypothetical protein
MITTAISRIRFSRQRLIVIGRVGVALRRAGVRLTTVLRVVRAAI